MNIFGFLSNAKKAVVAFAGAVLTGLTFAHTLTFLPSAWTSLIGVAIVALTTVLTWLAPGPKA